MQMRNHGESAVLSLYSPRQPTTVQTQGNASTNNYCQLCPPVDSSGQLEAATSLLSLPGKLAAKKWLCSSGPGLLELHWLESTTQRP
jgi:hypothetical protein